MTLVRTLGRSLVSPLEGSFGGSGLPWDESGGGGARGLSLLSGGTFTRSTEASYQTSASTVAWAAVNERRTEDRGDALGPAYLTERSRTNLALQSEALDTGAVWVPSFATVTANGAVAPDGVTDADRVAVLSGGFLRSNALTVSANPAVVSGSIWTRAFTGTETRQHVIGNATTTGEGGTHTETWGRRYVNHLVAVADGTSVLYLISDGRNFAGSGGIAAGARDGYLWGAQLENARFPTSYIRTVGTSVTRGADALSYAAGDYPVSFLTSGFRCTVALDCTSAELIADALDMRVMQVGADDYLRIRESGGACVVDLVCATSVVATKTITLTSRSIVLTLTAQPSAGTLAVAGATTGDGSNSGAGAAWTSGTLYVGTDDGGTNGLYGRIGSTVRAL